MEATREYPWGSSRRYHSYSEYMRRVFNQRVQKIAIDAGFTCPNRDGSISTGGCTFCNNSAFSAGYCNPVKDIKSQIQEGIEFHEKRKRKSDAYLVYFQSYSNTYGLFDEIRGKYEMALAYPGVVGIVIGTRPDCVNERLLDYLAGLNEKIHVMVEYGIESVHDKTLVRVNRGHDFQSAERAVRSTADRGIATGGHFIFGLPGESREDMLETARVISGLPLTVVKLHQLQIMKETVMAQEYLANPSLFNLFELEDYIDFIIEFLEMLSPSIVVERFASEVPDEYLVNHGWGRIPCHAVLSKIEARLKSKNTWQGRKYEICHD